MRLPLRTNAKILIAAVAAALAVGCDPGYELRPVGWTTLPDHKWSKQFENFEIRTKGIGGLIGEWWVDPDLQIVKNTKPILVRSAELRTSKETFQAKIYGSDPIPPSESGYHIPIEWKFDRDRAAPRVLGDHCEMTLNLTVGSEALQIKIEYTK